MKFFNCFIIVLVFTLIIACEKENTQIDIKGDWYLYNYISDSLKNDEIGFNYWEVYIADSLMFTYLSAVGYVNPSKYYLKNKFIYNMFDASPDSEFGYKSKVKLLSKNHLIFYNNKDTTNYYRLTNASDLLSNYVVNPNSDNPRFIDSVNAFAKAFQKRSNDCFLKNK